MFSKNNKDNSRHAVHGAGMVTTLAAGTTFNGDIESDSDMRIDGNVIGNIFCKAKVVLGDMGIVQGDLKAVNADIFGTVNGNVIAKEMLCLKPKAIVNGNLTTGKLQIEPNAIFNGQCKMTSEQSKTLPQGTLVLQDN